MLEIIINDQSVDIDKAVQFGFHNPILNKDGLPKGYSYPFKGKWTSRNINIFGHTYRLDRTNTQKEYIAVIRLANHEIAQGKVFLTNTDESSFTAKFYNEARNIAEQIKEVTLGDICHELVSVANPNPAKFRYRLEVSSYPADYVRITINNVRYDVYVQGVTPPNKFDALTDIKNQIEADYPTINVQYSLFNNHPELIIILPADYFEPFNIIPNEGLDADGLTIIEQRYQSTALQEAMQAHMEYVLANPTHHIFAYYQNRQAYSRGNFLGYINPRFSGNPYMMNTSQTIANNWHWSASPQVRLSFVLERILAQTEFSIAGSLPNGVTLDEILLFNPLTIDFEINDQGHLYFNVFKPEYNLKHHVPQKIKATDFLQRIKRSLFIFYKIEDGQLVMHPIADQLNTEAINISRYIEHRFNRGNKKHEGYIIQLQQDENDFFEDDTLADYTNGEPLNKYELIGTTNGKLSQDVSKEFALRLARYIGSYSNGASEVTAYTTPTQAQNDNAEYFKLLYEGDSVPVLAAFPPHILLKMLHFPKVRIETDNGTIEGIIEKIAFKADNTKMSKTKMEVRII